MFKTIKDFFKFINVQEEKDVIFYSEGSHDTIYYKNIIKILESKYSTKILILTSEKKDIAFDLKSKLTEILFIGDGFFRTITFMLIKSKVFIMSIPDLDNFFLKKNKYYKTKYIYIFHAVSSTNAAYNKKAFDNYDYIFCRGPHHKKEILENEKIYSLPKKKLIEHGCPVFDELAVKELRLQNNNFKNILIAPSWNKNDELIEKEFLLNLISNLLKFDFNVTLRIHPMTQRRKKNRIKFVLSKFNKNKKFTYSSKMENKKILKEHDILITDWSGISWEFSLMLGKITFFIDTNKKIMNSDYNRFENKPVEIYLRDKIGYLIKNYDLDELIYKLNSKDLASDFYREKFKNLIYYRENMFYNQWNSSEVAANEINKILLSE